MSSTDETQGLPPYDGSDHQVGRVTEFVTAMSKTGRATHIRMCEVESVEWDPQARRAFINLKSGRQHTLTDDRAYSAYRTWCEACSLTPAPEGTSTVRPPVSTQVVKKGVQPSLVGAAAMGRAEEDSRRSRIS